MASASGQAPAPKKNGQETPRPQSHQNGRIVKGPRLAKPATPISEQPSGTRKAQPGGSGHDHFGLPELAWQVTTALPRAERVALAPPGRGGGSSRICRSGRIPPGWRSAGGRLHRRATARPDRSSRTAPWRAPVPTGFLSPQVISRLASRLLIMFKSELFCREIVQMDLNLSQFGTSGSRWDQSRLPPIAHWSHPRWGLFLLLVLAGNVVVATLAWIIVGLVTR